jgi:hypothetical protein
MSVIKQDPLDGREFNIVYRVVGHTAGRISYYWTEEIVMFAFEEYSDGTILCVPTEQWKENNSETVDQIGEVTLRIPKENLLSETEPNNPLIEAIEEQ